MKLITVTPPTGNAISLEAVKRNLVIEHNDDDLLIDRFIKTAVSVVEYQTERRLMAQVVDLKIDCFPVGKLTIPTAPVRSVTSISYLDSNGDLQTLDSQLYVASLGSDLSTITPIGGWPSTYDLPDAVTIRLDVGYLPDELDLMAERALQLYVGHQFRNREASTPIAQSSVPMGFDMLVNQLKLWL